MDKNFLHVQDDLNLHMFKGTFSLDTDHMLLVKFFSQFHFIFMPKGTGYSL